MPSLRTHTPTDSDCADAILACAKHPALKHLRLAVTKRYMDPSEFPVGFQDHTNLTQNSPLLVAVAELDLQAGLRFVTVAPTFIVVDTIGLTRARSPRHQTVDTLLADLVALQLAKGTIGYAAVPITVTQHLSPEDAKDAILAADFQDFHTNADADDVKRRMGGV
ncbi:hypothetical protein [Burkholderia glumae]|uniref:hypothetical protein n=1 Tax=Burkholderia glumae TaxID=337 RepID=UPI002151FE2E|nr:hypothetical protein [Burkholderia glumae]